MTRRAARRTRILGVVVSVVLLAAGVSGCADLVAGSPYAPGFTTPTIPTANPHVVKRIGLPDPGVATGDPGGLVTAPPTPPLRYRGVVVVPACALLTVTDLTTQLGLPVDSSSQALPGPIQQTLIDPSADVTDWNNHIEANACSYAVGRGGGTRPVDITVHQPVYSGGAAEIDQQMRENLVGPVLSQAEGMSLQVADHGGGPDMTYWIRMGDVTVEFSPFLGDQKVNEKLLAFVIRRLHAFPSTPTGPPAFAYRSPVHSGAYVDACSITRWADLAAADPHAPLSTGYLEQGIATGVSLMQLPTLGMVNYIDSSCSAQGAGSTTTLAVSATTFDSPAAAAEDLATVKAHYGSPAATPQAGDESIVVDGFDEHILARKGRLVLQVSYNRAATDTDGTAPIVAAVTAAMMNRATVPAS